ncbi:conjugal transfer protein TraF [Shewanella sp. AS1]|uniref:conjugal transfer protein TraF n=1 Tax=Shewanella sp. AS1 TaxID=2907626 RepID=UPI001F28B91A|nr:conjugal transfer protein TraF [Shewanella sp. AS1]MCE9679253.1 conjugal transfer protein TraF [Shewanella sp. AS1]
MKFSTKILAVTLCSLSGLVVAGPQYHEARSDAMGGVGVASSNPEGAAFINPALLAIHAPDQRGGVMMLPVLGAEVSNLSDFQDQFDETQATYDDLDVAILTGNVNEIDSLRTQLIQDLQGLDNQMAFGNLGMGLSLVLPTKKMPIALFYKTYIDAVGVADVAQTDIDDLQNIDPNNPPALRDLDSQGVVLAGAVSDFGVALSFPLSIVNMPISVGVSPKLQRIDTYNYVISANNFDYSDFDDDKYRNSDNAFNLDIGLAMQPVEGMTLGLSGRNLISHNVDTVVSDGRSFTYHTEARYTAGIAYEWGIFNVASDLDLSTNESFDVLGQTQYWRFGGEMKPMDWVALRLGYRLDLEDTVADIYSFGAGFSIGSTFNLDLTGILGTDDTVGGVIQTSYHF